MLRFVNTYSDWVVSVVIFVSEMFLYERFYLKSGHRGNMLHLKLRYGLADT